MNPFVDHANGIVGFSDSHSGLAWQGILGLRYAISPNFDLGLKYRYFNVSDLNFGGTNEDRS